MTPLRTPVVTLAGVPVRLDPSLLLIVALVGLTVTDRLALRFATAVAVALALLVGVLLVLSVLAHELAHALEARRRGGVVGGITLFALGGVTELGDHGRSPRAELAVAAVGPWTSLVVASACGLLASAAEQWLTGGVGAAVGLVAGLTGWLNLALVAFNLLPAAPLDGGRMLHAFLWRATGDRTRASRVTGRLGQGLGAVLLVLGVLTAVRAPSALPAGLWSVVLGTVLFRAARAEVRRAAPVDGVDAGTGASS
jgi:Zn-dependent protease